MDNSWATGISRFSHFKIRNNTRYYREIYLQTSISLERTYLFHAAMVIKSICTWCIKIRPFRSLPVLVLRVLEDGSTARRRRLTGGDAEIPATSLESASFVRSSAAVFSQTSRSARAVTASTFAYNGVPTMSRIAAWRASAKLGGSRRSRGSFRFMASDRIDSSYCTCSTKPT